MFFLYDPSYIYILYRTYFLAFIFLLSDLWPLMEHLFICFLLATRALSYLTFLVIFLFFVVIFYG